MQNQALSETRSIPDGTLPILEPLTVKDATSTHWDQECDVLVVGLGAAGGAAALAAHEQGAKVLIAERFEGGGATTKSGGIVYLGGGTKYQKQANYDDTPEEMFKYLRQETGDAVSHDTLRRFCEGSRDLLAWLESIGVQFQSYDQPPKTSYPRDGIYFYYSGNEGVPAFAEHARPAPRGHRVKAPGIDSGRELYRALKTTIEKLGLPILRQTAVRRLVVNARGEVLGVEAWQLLPGSKAQRQHQQWMQRAERVHNFAPRYADGLRARALALELKEAKPLQIRARNGVILSTGGFIFNRQMVTQHAPKYRKAMRLGATGCDGSGIRLGASVGGVPSRMHKGSAWRFINPPTAWPKGIAVNQQGERFCNEQVYGARLGVEMVDNHEGRAWLILDKALRSAAFKEIRSGNLWHFQSIPAFFQMLFAPRARTPEALAEKIGLPAAALKSTVDRYTADAKAGVTDALGKSDDMRMPLDSPPYYAVNISADCKTFPCPTITLGGLRVDENSGAVLNDTGEAIPGLYAAGRTAVGIASNGYVSGLSLADCLWSGRRAGTTVANKGGI